MSKIYIKYSKVLRMFLILFSFIISIIVTSKVYFFLNPYKNNMIFSKNMLIAIKQYHVSFKDMFKDKVCIRIIEIILFSILIISKLRERFINILCIIIGLISGFYLTIFYLEMGYIGFVNLIIVYFPHILFYIAAALCLYNITIKKDNTISNNKITFKDKIFSVLHIILLWCMAILSETIINLYIVQKFFIISF